MKKGIAYFKREPMLAVSLLAAFASLFITKPQLSLLGSIDWHTLLTLFMMLTVLEGFKKENIFLPLLKFAGKIPSMAAISFFLVFCVFFSSMFVAPSVSVKFSEAQAFVLLQCPIDAPFGGEEQKVVALKVLHPFGVAREVEVCDVDILVLNPADKLIGH